MMMIKTRQAIGVLFSMVASREEHSNISEQITKEAYKEIKKVEARNQELCDAIERYRQAKEYALVSRIAPAEHYPDYMETEKALFALLEK